MVESGLRYAWPRSPSTSGAWLTPMPSRKRPPEASASVFCPAAMVIGSRAQMLAMPVATTICSVRASNQALCAKASRPTASGSQKAG